MNKCNGYKYVGQFRKIYNTMLRYAILAEIYGVTIPEDVEIHKLSEENARKYKIDVHTPATDRLLFLYGAGALDDTRRASHCCS